MATAILTSKGQMTIPTQLRGHLHLKTGDRVAFILQADGQVVLVPATVDVTELKGMLPPPAKPVTIEDMQRAIRQREGHV
jgi:AbrB family looped-hinge helix DNA binding protein